MQIKYEVGDVIQFVRSDGKEIRLWIQQSPSFAKRLNGISDDEDVLFFGRRMTKMLHIDSRFSKSKAFIVKQSAVRKLKHWEVL